MAAAATAARLPKKSQSLGRILTNVFVLSWKLLFDTGIRRNSLFISHQFRHVVLAPNHKFSRRRCQRNIAAAQSLNKYLYFASARSVRTRCLHDWNFHRPKAIDTEIKLRSVAAADELRGARSLCAKVFTRLIRLMLVPFIKWPPSFFVRERCFQQIH